MQEFTLYKLNKPLKITPFLYWYSNLCGRPSLFNCMHEPCMLASFLLTCEAVVGCVLGVENIWLSQKLKVKKTISNTAMFYYFVFELKQKIKTSQILIKPVDCFLSYGPFYICLKSWKIFEARPIVSVSNFPFRQFFLYKKISMLYFWNYFVPTCIVFPGSLN